MFRGFPAPWPGLGNPLERFIGFGLQAITSCADHSAMELTTPEAGTAGAARTSPAEVPRSPTADGGARRSGEEVLEDLRLRHDAGEELPSPTGSALDLAGARLVGADLSGLDLTGADLSDAHLLHCDLSGSRLVGAVLRNAMLHEVDLTGAELLGADLSGADLSNGTLDRAGFGQATAVGTVFFGATCRSTSFTGANLTDSDFRVANLDSSRMLTAKLGGADFSSATLTSVDLTGAELDGTTFREADLRQSRLKNVTGYCTADWIGADIQNVDFTGAWLLRRHIQDENYIHEFRTQSPNHERLYQIWWLTSDCGRSLVRWSLWTALIALLYAAAYTQVAIDWGEHRSALSPIYYSVVTFTTLGYGDVLPSSPAAQLLAMSEVVLGYLSLGGMMSILSDKMARRAG